MRYPVGMSARSIANKNHPHRKFYPVGAGSKWALEVEKRPRGFVALHQGTQTVVLSQQNLYAVAYALAGWGSGAAPL
jgi:hypothetical protein